MSLAARQRRVVILGGGFAGVHAARALTRLLGSRRDVHVELLSEENYFVFQPLLPEVAAGGVNANHVVNPIRDVAPKVQFRWCRITGIDCERKVVLVLQGEGRELVPVSYDYLIFALGKVADLSSMPGATEHSLAIKNLADAFRLRNHVLRCLELADIAVNEEERRALLTIVVAGGGFSGVETIGELSEMVHRCLPSFPNIDRPDIRMVLIHSRGLVLPEMAPALGEVADATLRRRGVEMKMNARVKAVTRHGVYLSTGEFIGTRSFICTIGNAANPIARDVLQRQGFVEGKIHGRGVGIFETDETLACTGRPGYWAIGDNAGIPNPLEPGTFCPPTAQFAVGEAKVCARNVLAAIDGRAPVPFRFKSAGMLASLGRRRAVAELYGFRFSGFFAWLAWRSIYLVRLPGIGRRLRVALDWALDLVFPRDIAQLDTDMPKHLRVDHYEPGELIIRKHEIGRELYVVRTGSVEVFQPADGHVPEEIVTELGEGEVFGEKALLVDLPRGASVRAKTAVDVLVMGRDDFNAMVRQFPPLGAYFQALLKERYPADFRDPS